LNHKVFAINAEIAVVTKSSSLYLDLIILAFPKIPNLYNGTIRKEIVSLAYMTLLATKNILSPKFSEYVATDEPNYTNRALNVDIQLVKRHHGAES
jgi:hypothetical protein